MHGYTFKSLLNTLEEL